MFVEAKIVEEEDKTSMRGCDEERYGDVKSMEDTRGYEEENMSAARNGIL